MPFHSLGGLIKMFSSSNRLFQLLSFLGMAGLFLGQVQAQSSQPLLRGKVFEPSRAPIVGAQILAIPDGRASGPATVSNEFGEFSLALESGSYTIKIIADGFEETSQTISLRPSGSEPLEILLPVAGAKSSITIIGTDYQLTNTSSATKTLTPLRNIPQSITVVTREQINDQQMMSLGGVTRYVPGVIAHQGENNRDQIS